MPVIPELPLESSGEVEAQRDITRRFIAADPSLIVLTPVRKIKQDSGSYVWMDEPVRPAQTFKMIPMAAGQKPTVILNGTEHIADYTILGVFDAEVEIHDWFVIADRRYTVVAMADGHGYETKALVEAHG